MSLFRILSLTLLAAGFAIPLQAQTPVAPPASYWIYVGTMGGARSQGITLLKMDTASERLTTQGIVAKAQNPNYFALHPRLPILYAVMRSGADQGSQVAAYGIDAATGHLRDLGRRDTGGAGACYVSITPDGRTALVAHYNAGSVSALPLDAAGVLGPVATVIAHHGSSINPRRQEGPHAHCFDPDPAGRFALAADLGLDQVLVYRLDSLRGGLEAHGSLALPLGVGPRHLAFAGGGRFVYVISEMAATVTVCQYDAQRGQLESRATVATLPPDYTGERSGAEICVHPAGRFVYVSNRGHNSIGCFAINPGTGGLTAAGVTPTQGKTPRSFAIDPAGTLLVALNQDSDSVVPFGLNPATGVLTPLGQEVKVICPVCALMVPATGDDDKR